MRAELAAKDAEIRRLREVEEEWKTTVCRYDQDVDDLLGQVAKLRQARGPFAKAENLNGGWCWPKAQELASRAAKALEG